MYSSTNIITIIVIALSISIPTFTSSNITKSAAFLTSYD